MNTKLYIYLFIIAASMSLPNKLSAQNVDPWHKVGTDEVSRYNNEDSYLNAKVVIGSKDIVNNANLTVGGGIHLSGDLGVTKNTKFNNDLFVTGLKYLTGNTLINNNLFVGIENQKALKVNGNLSVSGATAIKGSVNVKNNLTVSGISSIFGATEILGNLTVGTVSVPRTLTILGDTYTSTFFGVGTTNPSYGFHVEGATALSNGLFFRGTTTPPAVVNRSIAMWNGLYPGRGETEFINARGSGSGGFSFMSFNSPVGGGGTPVATNIISKISTTGAYTVISDRRIKSQVRNSGYGLAEIMKLRPVNYNFHSDRKIEGGKVILSEKSVPDIGFIAQEVEQVVPIAVTKPQTDEDLYMISLSKLIPVLTKAIQEQQEIMDTQEKVIEKLRERVEILKRKSED